LLIIFLVSVLCVAGEVFHRSLLNTNKYPDAKCLDGTTGGYYVARGRPGNNKWVFYFQGGGWCYQEQDCYSRALFGGSLGSSNYFDEVIYLGGILSENCDENPISCEWNKVFFPYCDGMSFSGNRLNPILIDGSQGPRDIWFKGRSIVESVVRELTESHGFNTAEELILTGCSAGGLASYFQADNLAKLLPSTMRKYGVSPDDGFFAEVPNVVGQNVYPDQMKYIFNLANASAGVDPDCVANQTRGEEWKCAFAHTIFQYIQTPIFVVNSAYDLWQFGCILTSVPVPDNSTANGDCFALWRPCSFNPSSCSTGELNFLNDNARAFISVYSNIATSSRRGNGAFIHSCAGHCENWFVRSDKGDTTLREAFLKWWNSDFRDEPSTHTHLPCYWNTNQPYNCNPTCSIKIEETFSEYPFIEKPNK